MPSLLSIEERLNNQKLSKIEESQRGVFKEIVEKIKIDKPLTGKALSVSCGDGIWDYILFKNNSSIRKIVATDIVSCPVKNEDQKLLNSAGNWQFIQINRSGILPFEDGEFDFVYHEDVIEHVENPFCFLKEQYRVLKKGGSILIGTPNLFRPANVIKLLLGRLRFPVKIGHNEEIGDYIHIPDLGTEASYWLYFLDKLKSISDLKPDKSIILW